MADDAAKPLVPYGDFSKLDLRVAKIVSAERVPNADKLLRLTVDVGGEERQVLAGVAEFYAPESLVGRSVVLIANLEPRVIRGLESRGMLLAAAAGGRAFLLQPDADVPSGTPVR